jgi:hypothetical protein
MLRPYKIRAAYYHFHFTYKAAKSLPPLFHYDSPTGFGFSGPINYPMTVVHFVAYNFILELQNHYGIK